MFYLSIRSNSDGIKVEHVGRRSSPAEGTTIVTYQLLLRPAQICLVIMMISAQLIDNDNLLAQYTQKWPDEED
jgi:hypothetical protein